MRPIDRRRLALRDAVSRLRSVWKKKTGAELNARRTKPTGEMSAGENSFLTVAPEPVNIRLCLQPALSNLL